MNSSLEVKATDFANQLNRLIKAVFGTRQPIFTVVAGQESNRVSINTTVKVDGIDQVKPIRVGFEGRRKSPSVLLFIEFDCAWSSEFNFLSVERSTMTMKIEGNANPLFRYDFDKNKTGELPTAYIHVHAHRDEISWLLLQSDSKRTKSRKRKGKMPLLSEIHFPVGGERFRPCLEDFLEFSILEFGLKSKRTALDALQIGRISWRQTQLRAAISDFPEVAADALIKYGWKVEPGENARYSRNFIRANRL